MDGRTDVGKISPFYRPSFPIEATAPKLGLNLIKLGLGSLVGLFGDQWANSGLKGGILGLKGGKREAQMSQLGAQMGPAWGSNKPT